MTVVKINGFYSPAFPWYLFDYFIPFLIRKCYYLIILESVKMFLMFLIYLEPVRLSVRL